MLIRHYHYLTTLHANSAIVDVSSSSFSSSSSSSSQSSLSFPSAAIATTTRKKKNNNDGTSVSSLSSIKVDHPDHNETTTTTTTIPIPMPMPHQPQQLRTGVKIVPPPNSINRSIKNFVSNNDNNNNNNNDNNNNNNNDNDNETKIDNRTVEESEKKERENGNITSSVTTIREFGKRWKKLVKKELQIQEKVRGRGTKPKSYIRKEIHSNFQRLQHRLQEVNTTHAIDIPSQWHTVTPSMYQEIRTKARTQMQEIIHTPSSVRNVDNTKNNEKKIHTDCILWLVPPSLASTVTAIRVEKDDLNPTIARKDKIANAGPQLQFQCNMNTNTNTNTNTTTRTLQDEPCSSAGANLCLVRTEIQLWNTYYSVTATESSYNYTELNESILQHKGVNRSPKSPSSSLSLSSSSSSSKPTITTSPSVLLTLVDTIEYLQYGKRYIWECFLNKASYAHRTDHPFYIWIGNPLENKNKNKNHNKQNKLSTDDNIAAALSSSSLLHQREIPTVSHLFGTHCSPESLQTNTINYYKSIAMSVLFQQLIQTQTQQKPISTSDIVDHKNEKEEEVVEEHRVWFVDADIFFNEEAFPTLITTTTTTTAPTTALSPRNHRSQESHNISVTTTTTTSITINHKKNEENQKLDDYFELSTQASVFGSQNPSGKNENILVNGGLLGLRLRPRTRPSKSQSRKKTSQTDTDSDPDTDSNSHGNHDDDEWVLDFAALWWYCRCGERDQIALWLVLFATWSAESHQTINNNNHHHHHHHGIKNDRAPTTATSSSDRNRDSSSNSPNIFSYPGIFFENYLFAWFGVMPFFLQSQLLQSSSSSFLFHDGGNSEFLNSTHTLYTYPLELPHVLLLPLTPFVVVPQQQQQQQQQQKLPAASSTSTSTSSTSSTSTSTSTSRRTTRMNFPIGLVKKNQSEKKTLLSHNKNMYNTCYNMKCYPYLIRADPSSNLDS